MKISIYCFFLKILLSAVVAEVAATVGTGLTTLATTATGGCA